MKHWEQFREGSYRAWLYTRTLFKWLCVAGSTGALCGLIGSLFHIGVKCASEMLGRFPWLLFCLPLAGLIIVAIYKLTKTEGLGTDAIIEAVQMGKKLPFWLLPAIFFGTVLTHLCGGSAGREGAALQMGGTIGQNLGRAMHLDNWDLRIATLGGMAAFFAALFGTPLSATIFSITVIRIGTFYPAAYVPCLIASLVAYGISRFLGVEPTRFIVIAPSPDLMLFFRVAGLAILCALVSMLFCRMLLFVRQTMERWIPNPWIRAAVGGGLIILLTFLVGCRDYNGTGMGIITETIQMGTGKPEAFLLKILFTAITLGAGFRGGEVVPAFFIGASFGCTVGPLLGIPAEFSAALGLVSVFCGVTNCPLTSIMLSVELFGANGMWYFALSCGLSYMLSGYSGLYSSQTILYSKLRAQYINVHTNAHRVGQVHAPEKERDADLKR